MPDWRLACKLDELTSLAGLEVVIEDRIVALFQVDQEIRAIDGICAHAGGPLAKGRIDGNIVTCPWHGWQYDVSTGRHCLTPNICQQSFPVKVEGNEVYVALS